MMEAIYEAVGIDWKTAGRQIRPMCGAMDSSSWDTKPNDSDCERPLYLSRDEAMRLLVLCAASPETIGKDEETLFAKIHDHLRQF